MMKVKQIFTNLSAKAIGKSAKY